MANTLLTIGMITRKALQLFRNSNAFLQMIDRQYSNEFAKSGAKIGSTVKIRLPNDYVVRTGATAVPQATNEQSTTLTLATQQGVDLTFSSAELALSMDDFSDRVLEPAVNALAGTVASTIMAGAEGIPNLVHNTQSTATISPTANTWLQAGAVLDIANCPRVNRMGIIDPLTMARSVNTLSGLYNPQTDISKQFKRGLISQGVLGFDWAMDQTVLLHTAGTFSSGGTVNGASQSGSTITLNAITGTFVAGDIITFAGVHQVNRVTKLSTGNLMQFVVTANVATSGTSVSIYPPLNPPVGGQQVAYQTVDASPADAAVTAIVIAASEVYRKNFIFHPTAATMATADLDLPSGATVSAGREAYDGISMRIVRDFITMTDQWLTRLDILYGYLWPRPEWACIVADAV